MANIIEGPADLEEATLADFDGNYSAGSGVVEASAGSAYAGSYGLHLQTVGTGTGNAEAYWQFTPPVSDIAWLKKRIRFDTLPTGAGLVIGPILAKADFGAIAELIFIPGGDVFLVVIGRDGNPVYRDAIVGAFAADTWYLLELWYNWSGANPTAGFKINGVTQDSYEDTTSGATLEVAISEAALIEIVDACSADVDMDDITLYDGDPDTGGAGISVHAMHYKRMRAA